MESFTLKENSPSAFVTVPVVLPGIEILTYSRLVMLVLSFTIPLTVMYPPSSAESVCACKGVNPASDSVMRKYPQRC